MNVTPSNQRLWNANYIKVMLIEFAVAGRKFFVAKKLHD